MIELRHKSSRSVDLKHLSSFIHPKMIMDGESINRHTKMFSLNRCETFRSRIVPRKTISIKLNVRIPCISIELYLKNLSIISLLTFFGPTPSNLITSSLSGLYE